MSKGRAAQVRWYDRNYDNTHYSFYIQANDAAYRNLIKPFKPAT